ncbi:MAG: metallophosphoesterase family protein [Desulfocucumaceae bacterium]
MNVAFISDIHGNLHALEAVLKDAGDRGIGAVYCAGDLVGYGPRPNEVAELIKKRGIPTVMGNYDDTIGNRRLVCGCDFKDEEARRLGEKSIAWTRENTTEENRLWLARLPVAMTVSHGGFAISLVHGSPRSMNEYIFPNTSEVYLEELVREVGADVLVCGHTHLPFVKKTAAGYVINAGSVGRPRHGNPKAAYVVVEAGAGRIAADIIEVSYNYEETAREIERFGLPAQFAEIIRTGSV